MGDYPEVRIRSNYMLVQVLIIRWEKIKKIFRHIYLTSLFTNTVKEAIRVAREKAISTTSPV